MPLGEDDGDPPDFVAARDHVVESVLELAGALRRDGAEVPANAGVDATRALVEMGFDDRDRVEAAMRASLVSRQEDLATFERHFPAFWNRLTAGVDAPMGAPAALEEGGGSSGPVATTRDRGDASAGSPADQDPRTVETRLEPAADDRGDDGGEAVETAIYSPSGRSEPVSADLGISAGEDDLEEPMERLTGALAARQGRRWAARAGEERVDVRRALRGSFGTGGTVVSVPTHGRKRSAVRATVLVDVSQSVLDVIDRSFLLRFLRRASEAWRSVRIFFFDTDLREVTGAFRTATPEAALEALARAETAWGGGTRIGHAIETIRREHPAAVDRTTATIVISDGLEVGEIDRLESGMAWLASRAGTVLWCNPLAASPEYEPTCRGMAAALPYVDGVFAFTGPDDVAEMAAQLARRGADGPIGYEFDARGRS